MPLLRQCAIHPYVTIQKLKKDKGSMAGQSKNSNMKRTQTFFTPFLTAIIHVIEEIKTIFLRMQFLLLTFEVVKSFFLRWHNLSYSIY